MQYQKELQLLQSSPDAHTPFNSAFIQRCKEALQHDFRQQCDRIQVFAALPREAVTPAKLQDVCSAVGMKAAHDPAYFWEQALQMAILLL